MRIVLGLRLPDPPVSRIVSGRMQTLSPLTAPAQRYGFAPYSLFTMSFFRTRHLAEYRLHPVFVPNRKKNVKRREQPRSNRHAEAGDFPSFPPCQKGRTRLLYQPRSTDDNVTMAEKVTANAIFSLNKPAAYFRCFLQISFKPYPTAPAST